METCDTSQLQGKKVRDVYTTAYDVRETMFSDQTGQYPTRSQRGNKYIMVMVEIDSNAILVEPMKSRKDAEMIRAYDALLLRLKLAGIVPKKHVLDNEVSENMKTHIRDTCKLNMELVPPGCHRRNAAEVAIRNFKAHFLSVLAGVADDFPPSLWDRLLPQTEITVNLKPNSTVKCYSECICICTPQWTLRLQQNATGTNGMQCTSAREDRQARHMGIPLRRWMVSLHLTRALSYAHVPHQAHQERTIVRHGAIPTQAHHQPHHLHADKVMLALAECVKAIKGLTGQDKSSPEAKDLQRIVDATRATLIKQPRRCEEPIRHDDVPQQTALPRVPAAFPRVPAALPGVPPSGQWSNWDPKMTTPLPRVPTPTINQQASINRIAEAARRERRRKRQVGIRQRATTTSVQ